jgi:large subunit ribosomal protein L5
MEKSENTENMMRHIRVAKVVLNIGVGKSGEAVERAKKILEGLVSRRPVTRKAKQSIRDFGVHRGEPIGVSVTLRGETADKTLKRLLATKEMKLPQKSFDATGNCSFGIKEHIDIPGVKYDPDIGIFGMNASVVLHRPGYRVVERRRITSKIGKEQIVSKEDAIDFFRGTLGVEVY